MEIIKTKKLTDPQFQQINQLWNDEYPVNLKDRFGILLDGIVNFHHYLIEDKTNKIIAWAVDFEKENEIRFSIIVSSSQQGKGLGKLLIDRLKNDLKVFYGWVIDHNDDLKIDESNYKSPIDFYLKQGAEILKDQRIETDIISCVKIKF